MHSTQKFKVCKTSLDGISRACLECVCIKSANVPTRWSTWTEQIGADVGFQGEVIQSYGCCECTNLQFVSASCASCTKIRHRVHTWEDHDERPLGSNSNTVKIVYGLPKVINLPTLWKLIGLNILEGPCSQSVSLRCADTEISGCCSGPLHAHSAVVYG